jgi:hypothetical protein
MMERRNGYCDQHPTRRRHHCGETSCCRTFLSTIRPKCLWGDGHVKFSTTKAAFDPKLWGETSGNNPSGAPGDDATKFRTIISLLRP